MILNFLELNKRRTRWTFFQARRDRQPGRGAVPDIVLEVGGRTFYVDILSRGGGALGIDRQGRQMLARRRGAPCYVVRSVPYMEQVLRGLGIQLKPSGHIMDGFWRPPKPSPTPSVKPKNKGTKHGSTPQITHQTSRRR